MKMFTKIFWIGVIMVLLLFLFIGSIKVYIHFYAKEGITTLDNVEKRDFVIIPGSKVYKDHPSEHLRERLECGITLYQKGLVSKMIISGGFATNIQQMETDIMYDYLLQKGIPKEDIYIDSFGINTYNTMLRAHDFIKEASSYVCTQKMYASRTEFLAKKVGLNAITIEADLSHHLLNPWLYIREFLAPTKAFLETTFKREEKYSLEEKPIIQK